MWQKLRNKGGRGFGAQPCFRRKKIHWGMLLLFHCDPFGLQMVSCMKAKTSADFFLTNHWWSSQTFSMDKFSGILELTAAPKTITLLGITECIETSLQTTAVLHPSTAVKHFSWHTSIHDSESLVRVDQLTTDSLVTKTLWFWLVSLGGKGA